jgi:hypothetical protein
VIANLVADCSDEAYALLREREASYQMKVVAVALPAVARSVDQSAYNGDAEPTNRALFCRSVPIRRGMSERIEGRPVVDEIDCQATTPPIERYGDAVCLKFPAVAVGNNVGEKLFEDDQEPRSFVIGKTAITSERLGKGFKPDQLGSFAAQVDRSSHRDPAICISNSGSQITASR